MFSRSFQLEDEFRYLQRKRNADLAETRSKVRVSSPDVLHCPS